MPIYGIASMKRDGKEEGLKDRPCVIVLAMSGRRTTEQSLWFLVLVLPLTAYARPGDPSKRG